MLVTMMNKTKMVRSKKRIYGPVNLSSLLPGMWHIYINKEIFKSNQTFNRMTRMMVYWTPMIVANLGIIVVMWYFFLAPSYEILVYLFLSSSLLFCSALLFFSLLFSFVLFCSLLMSFLLCSSFFPLLALFFYIILRRLTM